MVVSRRVGKPCKYTETRSESLIAAHHGRDQIQKLTLSAEADGTVTGLKVELLADMGAYLGHRHAGCSDPRCLHVQRDLQVPGVPLRLHQHLHQPHLDRRLSWCRPARGDVRDRADHGRARRRARRRPDGDPQEELDQARGVPVHDRRRSRVRQRQLRGSNRQGDGVVRVRRAARRAAAASRLR